MDLGFVLHEHAVLCCTNMQRTACECLASPGLQPQETPLCTVNNHQGRQRAREHARASDASDDRDVDEGRGDRGVLAALTEEDGHGEAQQQAGKGFQRVPDASDDHDEQAGRRIVSASHSLFIPNCCLKVSNTRELQ